MNLLNLKVVTLLTNLLFSHFLLAKEKITLVTEHLPPYQIIENNQVTGFATEIIAEVMALSQYPYEINGNSWVRSYNLTLAKENHCIYSIARLPIREHLFAWIGRITEQNNAVMWGLKSNNKLNIENIEDAKQYLTAVNKDDVTHLGLLAEGFIEGKHLYVLNNTESLIKLLVTRPEIELIVADDITISYRAKLAGVDINLLQRQFELKNLPLNFYLACNKNTKPEILTTLAHALTQVHKNGTYQNILNKWKSSMPHLK